MAIKNTTSYVIGLDIEQSDKTKRNIEELKGAFDSVDKSLEDIEKQYQDILKTEGDHKDETKAYNQLLLERYKELEKQNDLLQRTSAESRKADRERLHSLHEIQAQRRLTTEETAELKRLEKSVLDISDEELANQKRLNAEQRRQIQMMIQGARQEIASKGKLAKFMQNELDFLKKRIKSQFDFIKALKTTEGRYAAIQKIASKGAKLVKGAAMGAAGFAGAAVGSALAGAETQANTEREARRMKVGLSNDEKIALIGQLQIATGKDAASVVDAINRTTNAVKTKDPAQLAQMAQAELEFPGASALFQASGKTVEAKDYTILQNRLRAIQSATGANISDLSTIMQTVSNLRDSAFKSGISQQDIISLYSALQGSNAFDDQEHIERAMKAFLAQGGLTPDNFYDRMQQYDWSRHVDGSQQINQAEAFMKTFDFGALKAANVAPAQETIQKTAAEKAAETARRISVKKDELLMKILNKIEPMLNDGTLENIIDMIFKTLENVLPLLDPIMKLTKKILDALSPVIEKVVELINRFVNALSNSSGIKDFFDKLTGGGDDTANATPQKAQGGIALSPTIVGERGAEAIIPLDYARRGRATDIVQNITQTFNLRGNQTTALSLGQAMKSRSFADNFVNSRIYGGIR